MNRIFVPLCCAALALSSASCTQAGGPLDTSAAPASSPHPASAGPRSASQAGAAPAAAAATTAAATQDVPRISVGAIEGAVTVPPSSGESGAGSSAQAAPANGTPQQSAPRSSQTVSGAAPASRGPVAAPVIAPDRRASSLIGMRVESASGKPLGFVQDIIFDRNGRATHLVIAFGDEGNGGKLTAVPWTAAVSSLHDDHLVIDGAKLQAAPSFIPGEWPDIDAPHWSAAADAYWRGGTGPRKPRTVTPIDSTARTRARPTRPYEP